MYQRQLVIFFNITNPTGKAELPKLILIYYVITVPMHAYFVFLYNYQIITKTILRPITTVCIYRLPLERVELSEVMAMPVYIAHCYHVYALCFQ